MKKKLALLLAAVMTFSLTACGGESAGSGTAEPAPAAEVQTEASEETASDSADWPVISVQVASFGDAPDEQMVEDATNDYLRSIDAGVLIDYICIAPANTATTLQLMLTGGDDPIDLYNWRWWSSITGVVRNEQALPLDQYKEQYPELWEICDERVMRTQQVAGTTYAFPTMDGFCTEGMYVMRKDIADELGVSDLEGTKISLEELTDILYRAKEAHPEYCYMFDTENQSNLCNVDNFGNPNYIGVLENVGDGQTKIVNHYETDTFYNVAKQIREWNEHGLFQDDPLNNSVTITDMNEGITAGFFCGAFSVSNLKASVTYLTMPVVVFYVSDLAAMGSSVGGGWCVSTVSKHPDAAMKMLSLLLTDGNMMNFISHGVEGYHYIIDEDGIGRYNTEKGMDSNYTGWTLTADWFYPNRYISIPFDTDNKDVFVEMANVHKTAKFSSAMGFNFNSEPVYDQYTAVSAVIDEYKDALRKGLVDVDEYLPRFQEELRKAGIDEVIAEEQRQFDEFLAQYN